MENTDMENKEMTETPNIPNGETLEAMHELKEAEFRKRARRYSKAEELLDDLDS